MVNAGLLYATVGAIARDIFVCEERTKFYTQRLSPPSPTRENSRPTPTVIWLPRKKIRYIGRPERTPEELGQDLQDIAPSDVPGHFRRCENPSPKQLELARFYRVNIPECCTFVKPHCRLSYSRRDPVYKSRSALQVLFAARDDSGRGG